MQQPGPCKGWSQGMVTSKAAWHRGRARVSGSSIVWVGASCLAFALRGKLCHKAATHKGTKLDCILHTASVLSTNHARQEAPTHKITAVYGRGPGGRAGGPSGGVTICRHYAAKHPPCYAHSRLLTPITLPIIFPELPVTFHQLQQSFHR